MIDFVTWAYSLIQAFGYIGIFGVALFSTFSIVFPTFPLSAIVVFSVAMGLNPILIAVFAGVGSATGELVGFVVGRGSEKILLKKYKKRIDEIEVMFQKYKGWVVIMFFSFLPIVPVDFMGMFSGLIGYDMKKFYVACVIGKTLRYLLIVATTFYGIELFSEIFATGL